ncbi:MAG: hypothetical protein EOP04_25405 [Proteobacteria bacterium]|nr:MAG: hypothetical protein EOP04_25405 [Pseudomonadota bacterium]
MEKSNSKNNVPYFTFAEVHDLTQQLQTVVWRVVSRLVDKKCEGVAAGNEAMANIFNLDISEPISVDKAAELLRTDTSIIKETLLKYDLHCTDESGCYYVKSLDQYRKEPFIPAATNRKGIFNLAKYIDSDFARMISLLRVLYEMDDFTTFEFDSEDETT